MVYGCSARTIKCLVFFFNLLAFAAGVAILAICVRAYVQNPLKSKHFDFIDSESDISSMAIVLYFGMALGILVAIIGFLGCCGAFMESKCLLGTFSILVGLLAVGQVAVGVALLVKKKAMFEAIEKTIDKVQHAAKTGNLEACQLFNDLSNKFQMCCFQDGNPIHITDCTKDQFTCKADTIGKKCSKEIQGQMNKLCIAAAIVTFIIVAIETLAIIFATCLCCAIE